MAVADIDTIQVSFMDQTCRDSVSYAWVAVRRGQDAAPHQVLNEPDKSPESLSYMWVQRTGDSEQPIVLFDYAPSRGGTVVKSLLGDYGWYLQTDDYAGYGRCLRLPSCETVEDFERLLPWNVEIEPL